MRPAAGGSPEAATGSPSEAPRATCGSERSSHSAALPAAPAVSSTRVAPAGLLASHGVDGPVGPPEPHGRLPVAAGRALRRRGGVAADVAVRDPLVNRQGGQRLQLEDVVV